MFLAVISISFIGIILLLLFIYAAFASGTPKNFDQFRTEVLTVGYGFLSAEYDLMIGWFYNKVALYPQSSSVAVITGGGRGLGLSALEMLLKCEMTVVIGVRDIEAAKKSVEAHIEESLRKNRVIYETCDTSEMTSVRNFASNIQRRFKTINIIINNAGIMGAPYKSTNDGFEYHMAVNYIGHFLLAHLLMPQLIAGSKQSHKASRIVNVSSSAHRAGAINYDDFNSRKSYYTTFSYSSSKLAQVMFTRHLQKVCTDNSWGVNVYACHPGIVETGIFQYNLISSLSSISKLIMKTPEEGARSLVYSAISPEIESKGGCYIINCGIEKCSRKAMDNEACKKLFDFTCGQLNIENFGNAGSQNLMNN